MEHERITEQIIGCAYRVHNSMGFGFLESIYEKCMSIELTDAAIAFESQKPITVKYRDQVVGQFVADLYVEGPVIVELKSVRSLAQSHEIQLVNYLVATGTEVGLLINFAEQKVEVKRKVRRLSKRCC